MSATTPAKGRVVRWGALAVGVVLFFVTLYYINFRIAFGTIRQLGVALPLALVLSGLWHLARTWAWAWCFPRPRKVTFLRLARVRLAAEAFSYLTLRGIAGEPLKVVLLADSVDAREATAAVALERVAYIIGTTVIVGIGSILAIATLPLTPVWFRVFRAFAIAAGVIAALTALVVSGRGTYFQSALARLDRVFSTRMSAGRVPRFISAVERYMLALVRDNPWRLAVLLTATVAAYACMALEAWVILRAAAPAVSFSDAVAVETFSRVASFGSAFIPANLGALEASSVAAAAAVGAVGGGAALALARRLRGLFWAGLGLAIYPRARRHPSSAADSSPEQGPDRGPALFYFPEAEDVRVSPETRLAGLPVAERVVRAALKAGYARVLVWAPASRPAARPGGRFRWLDADLRERVTVASTEDEWLAATAALGSPGAVTAIGAGLVVSPALLASALVVPAGTSQVADVPAGPEWPESGVLRVARATAVDRKRVVSELHARRERALPLPSGADVASRRAMLAVRMTTPDDLPAAEKTIRRSTYKDTDATFARFNRGISLPISIALIRTPLTANQLSVILVAIGFYSAWLFSIGHYWTGVLGGFLSLAASVLDGCDGEIARLKYQESALGCWIETVGDYSYYIAIFTGLTIGAVRQTQWQGFYYFGGLAVCGTLLTFALLIYLRTRITAGRPEKLHAVAGDRFQAEPSTWSRIVWRISFLATRSAMPYGIMAFALCFALPGIVVLAAIGSNIYWISLVLKFRHLLGEREAARPDRLRPA
jgi:phosphatidylglycerophosphate synthase